MSLRRVLEPELMLARKDAREYAEIDHSRADSDFVRVLSRDLGFRRGKVADLGAGTCGISLEICRRIKGARVTAVELSPAMLELAAAKMARSRCLRRIGLLRADVKATRLPAGAFDFVVCNNLVHHIAEPLKVFREIARLLRRGGGLFVKDLRRPRSAAELAGHMRRCSGDSPRQRELLRNSLKAALLPEEAAAFAKEAGLEGAVLCVTGERHWELRRPAE